MWNWEPECDFTFRRRACRLCVFWRWSLTCRSPDHQLVDPTSCCIVFSWKPPPFDSNSQTQNSNADYFSMVSWNRDYWPFGPPHRLQSALNLPSWTCWWSCRLSWCQRPVTSSAPATHATATWISSGRGGGARQASVDCCPMSYHRHRQIVAALGCIWDRRRFCFGKSPYASSSETCY